MNSKITLTVFAVVAALAVAGLFIPAQIDTAEAKKNKAATTTTTTNGYGGGSNGGGDTEIEVRDFLNENNNECKFAECFHQGSGDDEVDDVNF